MAFGRKKMGRNEQEAVIIQEKGKNGAFSPSQNPQSPAASRMPVKMPTTPPVAGPGAAQMGGGVSEPGKKRSFRKNSLTRVDLDSFPE